MEDTHHDLGRAWRMPAGLRDLPGPTTDAEREVIACRNQVVAETARRFAPGLPLDRIGYNQAGIRYRDTEGRIVRVPWNAFRMHHRTLPRSSRRPAPAGRAHRSRREAHGRRDKQNAPPDTEGDLSGLPAGVRAVEVYRRSLGHGPRPISAVRAALVASGLTPDSGTDRRARRALGVVSRPDGWQGEHVLSLPDEPHPPITEAGVTTRSALGDTEADHRRRHRANVRAARRVVALRSRVTGIPIGGAR